MLTALGLIVLIAAVTIDFILTVIHDLFRGQLGHDVVEHPSHNVAVNVNLKQIGRAHV